MYALAIPPCMIRRRFIMAIILLRSTAVRTARWPPLFYLRPPDVAVGIVRF